MLLDPRIAMMGQVPDIAGAIAGGMQFHDQRAKQSKLADLLPQAAHGDQTALDELWAVDPNIAEHMDNHQRTKAQAIIGDLSNAVHWADTPEKWQYVQQHYGQMGVDLSPYSFQDRERGLVALNQIGGYLKRDGTPTNMEREYQFLQSKDPKLADQFLHNKADGSPLVANNGDGTFTIIPRGYAGGQQQGGVDPPHVSTPEDYDRLPPGSQFITPDGHIRVKGGQSQPGSGGFPQ